MTDPIRLSQTHLMWEIQPGIRRLSQSIEMINQNADQYLFKIKGTSRSRFIVQPAHGLIKAFQKMKINFIVDLPPTTDPSRPINDKFMLFTLVAPPDAENKEGLDDYIKENVKSCHETVIQSTITFVRPTQAEHIIAPEAVSASGAPNYLEGTHGGEQIFQSLIEPKAVMRQEEKLDHSRLKADEELQESKVQSKVTTDSARTTPSEKPLTQTQTPVQVNVPSQPAPQPQPPASGQGLTSTQIQTAADPLTATQIDRLGTKEDEDKVEKLKKTIFKLTADLKSATDKLSQSQGKPAATSGLLKWQAIVIALISLIIGALLNGRR